MNCDEISIHLEAHFDGAATGELKDQIEAHLSGCHACAARLHQLKAMRKMLTSSVIPMPTDLLDKKVMDAFQDRRVSPPARRSNWRDLFLGSVLIPKPALTIPLALLVLAFLAGFQIGTKSAIQIAIPDLPKYVDAFPMATPIDLTKGTDNTQRVARNKGSKYRARPPVRRARRAEPPAAVSPIESFTTVSLSGANYSTKASLVGFEPMKDTTIRVIKGVEQR